jgi:ferric enterobactin receptor
MPIMKYETRILLLFTLLFFPVTFSILAQEKTNDGEGKITGRVIDSATVSPVEYAAVSLVRQSDGKVVNGGTANEKGIFELTGIAEGTYKLLIDFIGYKMITKENIVLSKANPNITLEDTRLVNKFKTLKTATVVEEKSIIENKFDKMVYNVEKDLTSQTGVAADVLKKVPQVSVDVDGNVELQGNSSIKFLINGKPSVIFGSNIAEVLQSIPASQIQSIEVITTPGAKYDAQGTGGIINIILKKNTAQGINGNISLSAGTRLENGSLNLSARKGKFGMNAFFSGNGMLQSTTINKMNRSSHDTAGTSDLIQNGTGNFSRMGYETGLGFDWEISPKDNLEGSVGLDYFGNNNKGHAIRESISRDNSGTTLSDINDVVNTTSKFYERTLDYELAYKRKFNKEDQELEIIYNSSNANNFSDYLQTQQHISSGTLFSGSHGTNPGIENEKNIMLNYTHPINEDFVIETGAKTELFHVNTTSDVYLLNTTSDNYDYNKSQSLTMDYKRNVYAGYLSASYELFDFLKMKTGVRYEYTEGKANYSNSGDVSFTPYNTIVPSIVMAHEFKKKQSIKLSYSRRIERPDYGDMNPFINAADPKNVTTGNPNLLPEIGDKIEAGYNKNFAKHGNINVTLFYRGNTNDIQSYMRYYSAYKIGDSIYTNQGKHWS